MHLRLEPFAGGGIVEERLEKLSEGDRHSGDLVQEGSCPFLFSDRIRASIKQVATDRGTKSINFLYAFCGAGGTWKVG